MSESENYKAALSVIAPEVYAQQYGQEDLAHQQALQQAESIVQADALESAGVTNPIGDAVKNIASGAITGLTGTAAFGLGFTPFSGAAEAASRLTRAIQDFSDNLGSPAEKARSRVYARQMGEIKDDLNRKYADKVARGEMSESEANFAKMGEEFTESAKTAFRTGNYKKIVTEGLGSLGTDILMSGGLRSAFTTAGKIAAKGGFLGSAAEQLSKAATATRAASARLIGAKRTEALAQGIRANAPWMLSTGAQEGGGSFVEQYLQGLEMSFEELQKNSPEFRERVAELEQKYGKTAQEKPEILQEARQDVALAAARRSSAGTAATAAALGYMTRWAERPFSSSASPMMGRLAAKNAGFAKRLLGSAVEGGTEPLEEGLSEASSQFFGNLATREFLNQQQQLLEGVGEAGAQGAIGGLGISAPHMAVSGIGEGLTAVGKAASAGASAVNGLFDAKDERNRQREVKDFIGSIDKSIAAGKAAGNNTAELESFKQIYQESQEKFAKSREIGGKTTEAAMQSHAEARKAKQCLDILIDNLGITGLSDEEQKVYRDHLESQKTQIEADLNKYSTFLNKKLDEQRSTYKEGTPVADDQLANEIKIYQIKSTGEDQDTKDALLQEFPAPLVNTLKNIAENPNQHDPKLVEEVAPIWGEYTDYDRRAKKQEEKRTLEQHTRDFDPDERIVIDEPESSVEGISQPKAGPVSRVTSVPTSQTGAKEASTSGIPVQSNLTEAPTVQTQLQQITPITEPKRASVKDYDLAYAQKHDDIMSRYKNGNISKEDAGKEIDLAYADLINAEAQDSSNALTPEQRSDRTKISNFIKQKASEGQTSEQIHSSKEYKEFEQKVENTSNSVPSPTQNQQKNTTRGVENNENLSETTPVQESGEDKLFWENRTDIPERDLKLLKQTDEDIDQRVAEKYSHLKKDAQESIANTLKQKRANLIKQYAQVSEPKSVGPNKYSGIAKKTPEEQKKLIKEAVADYAKSESTTPLTRLFIALTEITDEDKLNSLRESFEHEMEVQGYTYEELPDGQFVISKLSDKKARSSFANQYKELAKIFQPVRRFINFWKPNTDIYAVWHKLLTTNTSDNDPTIIALAKSLGFTNVQRLKASLGEAHKDTFGWPTKTDTIADHILKSLNPKGPLGVLITENMNEHLKALENYPYVKKYLTGVLKNGKDGFLGNSKDILRMTSVQMISKVNTLVHEMTEEEQDTYLPVPSSYIFTNDEGKLHFKGLPQQMFFAHLKTTVRKMFGIAPVNDALEEDVDDFLTDCAKLVADTLLSAGIIKQEEETYQWQDPRDTSEIHTETIKTVRLDPANENYKFLKNLFKSSKTGNKRMILEDIIGENFKNRVHFLPPAIRTTFNRSSTPITNKQALWMAEENQMARYVDTDTLNFLRSFDPESGGRGAVYLMKQGTAVDIDELRYRTTKDRIATLKGQRQTIDLAFERIETVESMGKDLATTALYSDHTLTSNGRCLEIGSSTSQNDKTGRALVRVASKPIDLTDEDDLLLYKKGLANAFGESTEKTDNSEYIEDVDNFIKLMQEKRELRYRVLNAVRETGKQRSLNDLKQLLSDIQSLDNPFAASIGSGRDCLDSLKAFIDLCQYANVLDSLNRVKTRRQQATNNENFEWSDELTDAVNTLTESLADWYPNFQVGTDAATSGPVNNAVVDTRGNGITSPAMLKLGYRGGINIGMDTSLDKQISKGISGEEREKRTFLGENESDIYTEAATKTIKEELQKTIASTNPKENKRFTAQKAKYAKDTIQSFLDLLKEFGYVNFNVDPKDKSLEKTAESIEFTRNFVKKPAQAINYSSHLKGTTRGLVDAILNQFNAEISTALEKICADGIQAKEAIADYNRIRGMLVNILTYVHTPEKNDWEKLNDDQAKKFILKNLKNLPVMDDWLAEKLQLGNFSENERGNIQLEYLSKDGSKTLSTTEIPQNFNISALAQNRLQNLCRSSVGIAIQNGVSMVLSKEALLANKTISAGISLSNALARGVAITLAPNGFGKTNANERKEIQVLAEEVGPYITYSSGNKFFVNKTKSVVTPLDDKNNPNGWDLGSVRQRRASAGLAGGAVSTHALDGSTMMEIVDAAFKHGIEMLSIHDSTQTNIADVPIMEQINNAAVEKTVYINKNGAVADHLATAGTVLLKHFPNLKELSSLVIPKEAQKNMTDAEKAIVNAVAHLYESKDFNGKKITNKENLESLKDLQLSLELYAREVIEGIDFNSSISSNYRDRQTVREKYADNVQNVAKTANTILKTLRCKGLIQNIANKVYKSIPTTYHHMASIGNNPYKSGSGFENLTVEKLIEFVEHVKGQDPSLANDDYIDILAKYINQRIYDEVQKSEEAKLAYEYLNGKDASSQWVALPRSIFDQVDALFRGSSKKKPAQSSLALKAYENANKWIKDPETGRVNKDSLRTVFKVVNKSLKTRKKDRLSNKTYYGVFSNILKAVLDNVPEDITIKMVSDLPVNYPHAPDAQGLYSAKDKMIFIVDQDTSGSFTSDLNAPILVHELIHATTGHVFTEYTTNGKNITNAQKVAIQNFEQLVNDLMNFQNPDAELPGVIVNFQRILNGIKGENFDEQSAQRQAEIRAEILDEAFAYINSNAELLRQIDKLNLHIKDMDSAVNDFRVKNLIKNLGILCLKLWQKIFNITNGIPDIITNFGVDSWVILNELKPSSGTDPNPNGGIRQSRNLDAANSISTQVTPRDMRKTLLNQHRNRAIIKQGHHLNFSEVAKQSEKSFLAEAEQYKDYLSKMETTLSPYVSASQLKLATQMVSDYMNKNILTDSDRGQLAELWSDIVSSIKDPRHAFVTSSNPTEEEMDKSADLFKLILGTEAQSPIQDVKAPSFLAQNFERPAILIALASTNPDIEKVVNKVKSTKFSEDTTNKPVLEKMESVLYTRLQNNKKLKTPLTIAAKKLFDQRMEFLDKFPDSSLNNIVNGAFSKADQAVWGAIKYFPSHLLYNFLLGVFRHVGTEKSKAKFRALPNMKPNPDLKNVDVNNLKDNAIAAYTLGFSNMLSDLAASMPNTFMMGKIRDLFLKSSSNIDVQGLYKKIKGYYDVVRKDLLEDFPKALIEQFKHNTLNKSTKSALHKAFLQTAIHTLAVGDVPKFFSDPKALNAEIDKIENMLDPQYRQYWIKKIKETTSYFMGKSDAASNLLTNAVQISRGFGDLNLEPRTSSEEHNIDMLLSLYSIKQLDSGTIARVNELFKSDPEAMSNLLKETQQVIIDENNRITPKNAINANYNWFPKGKERFCDFRLVPKVQLGKFKSLGYKVLEEYQSVPGDTSQTYYWVFTENYHNRNFMEGILQTINQTAKGFQLNKFSREEVVNSKITDAKITQKLIDSPNAGLKASGKPNLIPLYNEKGEVVGYERSVPAHLRRYLTQDNDIFTGLAQYKTRQKRETEARSINKEALRLCVEAWENASPEDRKTKFIDVFHSDDPFIKEAVARIDTKTMQRIRKAFGGNHFYVRKDEIFTQIGFRRSSIVDVYDDTFFFPTEFNKCLGHMFDLVFGERSRNILLNIESFVGATANYAKNTIVIRSLTVPAANLVSNIITLHMALGIPFKDIVRLGTSIYKDTEKYNRLKQKVFKLDRIIATTTDVDPEKQAALRAPLEQEKKRLETDIKTLSIYPLIEGGMFSTISDQGRVFEEVDFFSQKPSDAITTFASNLPSGFNTVVSNVLMTPNSSVYKATLKAVNYSDWIAKAITYKYLTEESETQHRKFDSDIAKMCAEIMFIDYDQFTTPGMDYLNNMGGLWFMMYKYRIFGAAVVSLMVNPSRAILGGAIASAIGAGTALTDNALIKAIQGTLGYSFGPGTIIRGILMHPLAVAAAFIL